MMCGRPIAVLALVFGIAWVTPALAEDEGEKGGPGRAAEQRSENADENSNAQWSDDAKRGQERAEERRGEPDRDAKYDDEKGKRSWTKEQRETWKKRKQEKRAGKGKSEEEEEEED